MLASFVWISSCDNMNPFIMHYILRNFYIRTSC